MKRRSFLCSSTALVGAGMLGRVDSKSDQIHPHRVHAASLMAGCATRFLSALDPDQRGKATFAFDTDERMNWHFIPKERKGLPLREMTPYQKHLASALLAAGLSQTGYIKAVTIMSLEDVLKIIENDSGEHRNPEKYYFSVFGTPSDSGTWGYRVEGHHLSQNYTAVNGKVIDGPSFFGANPAEVRQGPRKGLRTLPGEDDLGIELIHTLDEQQQRVAIVDPTAYRDILTAASRKAALQGQPSGLSASKMNARQFDLLKALMEEYARNVPDELAEGRIAATSIIIAFTRPHSSSNWMTLRTTPTTSTPCGATSPATSARTCYSSTTTQATRRNRTIHTNSQEIRTRTVPSRQALPPRLSALTCHAENW